MLRERAVRIKWHRKACRMRMPATTEGSGDRTDVSATLFARSHTVVATPITIVPDDAEGRLRGEAFADLTGQYGTLNGRDRLSLELNENRLPSQFIHELVLIA